MKVVLRYLVLVLLLSRQESFAADDLSVWSIETVALTCDSEPIPASDWPVASVTRFWVTGNTLLADFDVLNRSDRPLRLPSKNPDFQYWGATVLSATGEPVLYCGGVRDIDLPDTYVLEVLTPRDVVIVPPHHTASFHAVPLAPFWWYVWDYKPTSALIEYQGSAFSLMLPSSLLTRLGPDIHAFSELQCGLFPGPLLATPAPLPRGPEPE